ncbi:hypothetical protein VN12_07590 [Pirellula sp. SH-Sr6A]|nr:hypothetical protein VN12_07590 [Pirellula sp. SH-Sr6A]
MGACYQKVGAYYRELGMIGDDLNRWVPAIGNFCVLAPSRENSSPQKGGCLLFEERLRRNEWVPRIW